MADLLPSTPLLTAFLLTSLVLAITPGPGVSNIVAASVGHGRGIGLAAVAGAALGNLLNAVSATIGLAALLAVSAASFTLAKYAGAAFRDGLIVALLNSKTTLFYAAFLPQFMNPAGSALVQGLMLGGVFVVIAATTDDRDHAYRAGRVRRSQRRPTHTGSRWLISPAAGVACGNRHRSACAPRRADAASHY